MNILILIGKNIMWICAFILIFVFAPSFFRDIRKMWIKDSKSSAEGNSAERVKKNYHKHSISETPINLQEKSFIFGFEDDSK
jgi:uncharacterized membrane protein